MAEFTEIINALVDCVGRDNVRTDEAVLAKYGVDEMTPKVVVFPHNTEQVSGVVTVAAREGWSVLPWGSGTKIATGNVPKSLDLVLCTGRMNHMKDVDVANLTLTVEAGVKLRDIQARLATQEDRCYLPLDDLEKDADEIICSDRSNSGCFFPLDPAFSEKATIGGVIATNSSGPKRLLYTLPRDLILGAKFVAADGTVVGTGGKTVKNVSGYDISKLMIGSYGTLGILCEMTMRLLPLPEAMGTVVCFFKDFEGASAFADALLDTKMLPAAVEVMNGAAYESLKVNGTPEMDGAGYVAAVGLEHFEHAVARMKKDCTEMAQSHGALKTHILDEDTHSLFWLKVGEVVPVGAAPDGGYVSLKLNYPIAVWKDVVGFSAQTLQKEGVAFKLLAHAGSGVCLVTMDRAGAGVVKALLGKCRELGGNMAVQYAPTSLKGELPMWGEARSDFVVMKRLKEKLDPAGTMCPGRYVGGL